MTGDKNDAEQKKINMLMGESDAMRMSYLNVVRFFGEIPYPTISRSGY